MFGQSAGASNAFAIATMENASELVSTAAFQSGGGRDYATVIQAQLWHRSFAERLNCENIDVGHMCTRDTMKMIIVCVLMSKIDVLSPFCRYFLSQKSPPEDVQQPNPGCKHSP